MIALKILGITALVLVGIACLILIIFGIPGTWIFLGLTIVIAAIGGFQKLTISALLILLGLAILGEVIEFLVGYLGTRVKGASRKATISAIILSFIMAILMSGYPPILGSLLGAFLGAFIGAFSVEYLFQRKLKEAYQAGLAAVFGRVTGMISKIAVGVSMIVITVYYLV